MGSDFVRTVLGRQLERRGFLGAAASGVLGGLAAACGGKGGPDPAGERGSFAAEAVARPAGWTEASHGRETKPNLALIFPKDRVNQLTVRVSPESWQAMLDDMTRLAGPRGQGGRGAGGGFAAPGGPPPQGQAPQPGAGPGGPGGSTSENPMWVPAIIEFRGLTWTNVGFRFKGNSSLRSAWSSGTDKMPFKLDFDEFEDDFPEVKDQRFHGFRQLSLANGFGDATFMREAIVYDLLEESGLVAAETGFYEVFLDRGEGRTSLGLYTVIEVIDDTVVGRYFEDASGAIYEGDGPAASLAAGTRERIRDSFLRESKDGDWSEILALYDALHSAQRTSNPAAWRRGLEAVFDVASFLKWLALSAVIQHWDTYGAMTHNFYLYQHPGARRLNWISWDHNEVLRPSPAVGGGANAANLPAGGADNAGRIGGRNVTLDKREVGANWPLIRFLLDDPTYNSAYVGYLRETIEGVFRPERMEARYAQAASLLERYAGNGQAYRSAVASLLQVTRERHAAVRAFLDSL